MKIAWKKWYTESLNFYWTNFGFRVINASLLTLIANMDTKPTVARDLQPILIRVMEELADVIVTFSLVYLFSPNIVHMTEDSSVSNNILWVNIN